MSAGLCQEVWGGMQRTIRPASGRSGAMGAAGCIGSVGSAGSIGSEGSIGATGKTMAQEKREAAVSPWATQKRQLGEE